MFRRTLLLAAFLLILGSAQFSASGEPDVGANPLAHGAWLFRVHCHRCHGEYGKERIAEDYRSPDKLETAIADKGCRVSWARNRGGALSPHEIVAVSRYMLVWEELGREPDLPPLPEIPKLEAIKTAAPQPIQTAQANPVSGQMEQSRPENTLSLPLAKLISKNTVAKGAWLYTGNCYRCHLSYDQARMGRSLKGEKLQKMIEQGKTSTQMSGFAILAGGTLKNSDIVAIMSYITLYETFDRPLAIAPELLTPPSANPADLLPIGLPQFPRVAGDADLGKKMYMSHCSSCHGSDRVGYIGSNLTPPFFSLRPDLFLKSTVKDGIPGSMMKSFSENEGGKLSPKEIDSLVVYLLSASEHYSP